MTEQQKVLDANELRAAIQREFFNDSERAIVLHVADENDRLKADLAQARQERDEWKVRAEAVVFPGVGDDTPFLDTTREDAEIEREEAEATIAHLRASERDTREVLWLGHGHTGQYGDDGEMQCGACLPHYDYKGRPLADVARTALGALRTENTTLRAERDEARLEVKNAYNLFPPLLHAIDVALNGPAPDGVMRGYSTLPRQVEALRAALAAAQEVLRDIQGRPWPHRAGCVMFTSGYPLPCDCGLTDIETRISAALAQAAPAQGGEQ